MTNSVSACKHVVFNVKLIFFDNGKPPACMLLRRSPKPANRVILFDGAFEHSACCCRRNASFFSFGNGAGKVVGGTMANRCEYSILSLSL